MIKVTINGNFGTDIEQDETGGGTKTAKFRVGSTNRRYNSQTQQWEDKLDKNKKPTSSWVNAVAYGKNAEKVVDGFKKGDAVKVTGQLEVRDYEKDGTWHTIVEVSVAGIEKRFDKSDDGDEEGAE